MDIEEFVRRLEDPVFLTLFIAFVWCAIMLLIARVGGWSQLAGYYRATGPGPTQTWGFQSISLRYYTGYNGCITMGTDAAALHLSVWLPFRVGHPNLRIPWEDLHKAATPERFGVIRLFVTRAPQIPLRLRQGQIERLEAARGQPINVVKEGLSTSWS
ncbi:MAG: hypothetical protein QNJ73_12915 [Gammaproteobacteria bacterium]|nr:hypothetical protein [Gammaproteobacteria bacterium]